MVKKCRIDSLSVLFEVTLEGWDKQHWHGLRLESKECGFAVEGVPLRAVTESVVALAVATQVNGAPLN